MNDDWDEWDSLVLNWQNHKIDDAAFIAAARAQQMDFAAEQMIRLKEGILK